MKELVTIYDDIKNDFCSIWSFKERGATLEIITPFATTTNKFVSVFLTKRNDDYIVSDGGWISDNTYEAVPDFEDKVFKNVFEYFKNFFSVLTTQANKQEYYFKKTQKRELIPNLVFDMANFITSISNNTQIRFLDVKEKEESARFQSLASDFIRSAIPNSKNYRVKFGIPVDDKFRHIKFSAVVTKNNRLTLVNYITGSTPEYFTSSIGKTDIYFGVINKSVYKGNIHKKIAFVNDLAEGYNKEKMNVLLEELQMKTTNNILWKDKEQLQEIL